MFEKVVLIDDDKFFAATHLDELKKQFPSVIYCSSVGEAQVVLSSLDCPTLVVLDVMMPPPSPRHVIETENGETTGIWLINECFESVRDSKSKVVFFTNRGIEEIDKLIESSKVTEQLCAVLSKSEFTEEELAEYLVTRT